MRHIYFFKIVAYLILKFVGYPVFSFAKYSNPKHGDLLSDPWGNQILKSHEMVLLEVVGGRNFGHA